MVDYLDQSLKEVDESYEKSPIKKKPSIHKIEKKPLQKEEPVNAPMKKPEISRVGDKP
jgi:hypothetical protein